MIMLVSRNTDLKDDESLLLRSPKELKDADPNPLLRLEAFAFFFCSFTKASRADISP